MKLKYMLLATMLTALTMGMGCSNDDEDNSLGLSLAALAIGTGKTSVTVYFTNNGGSGWGSGNLGGRSGADSKCQTGKPSGLTCTATRAVLSVSATDTVANMPSTYSFSSSLPIRVYNTSTSVSTQVSSSWTAMLAGGTVFSPTLSSASGISSGYMATGATSSGGEATSGNCTDFTSGTGTNNLNDVDLTNGSYAPESGNCSDFKDAGTNHEYLMCVCQ